MLTRDMFPVLLNANAITGNTTTAGYDWARVDKSTTYELAWNPQTETYQYIDAANDSTEVTGFQTSMGQEIILDEKNRMYRLIDDYAWKFKTGSDTIIEVCLPRPYYDENGVLDKTKWKAKVWKEASVVPDSLNTIDKKYAFTLNLNGDPTDGYVTKDENGKFVFTEGEIPTDEPETVSTFSTRSKSTKETE